MGAYFYTGPAGSVLQEKATTKRDGETHKAAIIRKFNTAGLSTRVKVRFECSLRGIDPDVPGFGAAQTDASYKQALANLAGQIADYDQQTYGFISFSEAPPKAARAAASQSAQDANSDPSGDDPGEGPSGGDDPEEGPLGGHNPGHGPSGVVDPGEGPSGQADAQRADPDNDGSTAPQNRGIDESAIDPNLEAPQQVNQQGHPITAGKGLYYRGQGDTAEPSQRPAQTPAWMWRAYEDMVNAQRSMWGWMNDKDRSPDGQTIAAKDIMVLLEGSCKEIGAFSYGYMRDDAARQLPSPSFFKNPQTVEDSASEQGPSSMLAEDWPDRYPHRYDEESTTRYLPNWSRTGAPTWNDFKEAATGRGLRASDIAESFGEHAESESSSRDTNWQKGLKKPLDQYGRRGWQKGNLSAEMARRRIHPEANLSRPQEPPGGLPGGRTGTLPCHSDYAGELAEAQSATLHLLNYEMEGATRRFGGAILEPLQARMDELRARFHEKDGGPEGNTSEAGFALPPWINYPARVAESEGNDLEAPSGSPKRSRRRAESEDQENEEEDRVRKAARLGKRPLRDAVEPQAPEEGLGTVDAIGEPDDEEEEDEEEEQRQS